MILLITLWWAWRFSQLVIIRQNRFGAPRRRHLRPGRVEGRHDLDATHRRGARARARPAHRFAADLSPWIDAASRERSRRCSGRVVAPTGTAGSSRAISPPRAALLRAVLDVVVGRATRDVFMSLFNHYSVVLRSRWTRCSTIGLGAVLVLPRGRRPPAGICGRGGSARAVRLQPDGPFWSHHHNFSTSWRRSRAAQHPEREHSATCGPGPVGCET